MPVIELFEGIKILLFANDHNPPHFHVYYAGDKAMIEISTLEIMRGNLPNKQHHKVVEWAESRQKELLRLFEIKSPIKKMINNIPHITQILKIEPF